jgi:hypothetical protein
VALRDIAAGEELLTSYVDVRTTLFPPSGKGKGKRGGSAKGGLSFSRKGAAQVCPECEATMGLRAQIVGHVNARAGYFCDGCGGQVSLHRGWRRRRRACTI